MAKGKAPAFQFYVKDWLSDCELGLCSPATRGIWIDILCFMKWDAKQNGTLRAEIRKFARLVRSTIEDFRVFIAEAKEHEFCDISVTVTGDSEIVTVINRRLLRESIDRENARLRKKRSRESQRSHKDVTRQKGGAPSPSPSPTTNNKKKLNKEKVVLPDWIDDELWKDFIDHRKKLRAPMTDRAQEMLITKLTYLKEEGHNPKHLLINAIERGWRSVFA